jgi:hypothetical protein
MRGLIFAVMFAAALHAQAPQGSQEPAPPGAPYPWKRPWRQPSWKLFPDLKSQSSPGGRPLPASPVMMPKERIVLKLAQPCAIPLLNVLRRDNVDPKMILVPGPEVDGKIRIVAPPAPSCDDVK